MKIFKYRIPIEDNPVVTLPSKARILSVGAQEDRLYCWALVDEALISIDVQRQLVVVGTGRPIEDPDTLAFLGTVHIHEGRLVFHIFERF